MDAALTGGGGKNSSIGEGGSVGGRGGLNGMDRGKFGHDGPSAGGGAVALSACEEEAGAKDWGEKMEFDEWGETAELVRGNRIPETESERRSLAPKTNASVCRSAHLQLSSGLINAPHK